MQIFVRSYQDSDGDGRGDLRGLIQRPDYSKTLGLRGLCLMPVTQSQDKDHGYAVFDHRNIGAHYGSLADFDELLKQAHARGIGVIADCVINHSAAKNALFVKSKSANNNAYRDRYLWSGIKPAGWRIHGCDSWRSISANTGPFLFRAVLTPDARLQPDQPQAQRRAHGQPALLDELRRRWIPL